MLNTEMLSKGGPRLLVTDREGALYLERARIHVENDRVVYHIAGDEHCREYNIPHVNLAVLFIGQGASITQDAMRLLGEEGVHLAVTGSGGTPLHMGALTAYTSTRHFREMLPIYLSAEASLAAAKSVMRDRTARMRKIGVQGAQKMLKVRDVPGLSRCCSVFDANLKECRDVQQLLGFEGQFSKSCYAAFAQATTPPEAAGNADRKPGASKKNVFRRDPGARRPPPAKGGDDESSKMINRLIDHGNYLCYGMAGAALWALGIPPHMSVFHGKTRAGGLVFDLADSFKDALVLPLAFAHAPDKSGEEVEKAFRGRLIAAFDQHRILKEAIETVERMILAAQPRDPSQIECSSSNAAAGFRTAADAGADAVERDVADGPASSSLDCGF